MKVVGGGYLNEHDLQEAGVKTVGSHVRVHEKAILVDLERIEIGSHVRIDAFCVLTAAGGSLKIGNYVHIASHADVYAGAGIELDDFSGLSQGVRIYSVSDDYSGATLTNPTVPREFVSTIRGSVSIGRHVIIGSGSVILPGVTIGEGCAIGALSLVRKNLPSWGIYAGVPARRLGDRSKALLGLERRLITGLPVA